MSIKSARMLSDDSSCFHRVWFWSRYGSPRMAAGVMRRIAADEPAPYVPSDRDYGRCELGGDDCSERKE